MKRYKRTSAVLLLGLLLTLGGCGKRGESAETPTQQFLPTGQIALMGDHIECGDPNVRIDGAVVTVTAGGEYTVTGELNEGQLVVDTGETAEKVSLTLDNVTIRNSGDAAIHVLQADKVKLILPEGSESTLISGTEGMPLDQDANGAVVFSEDDLDIEGSGALRICGYINNGITCKDDLTVQGGVITVTAANNGLRGSESVRFEAGSVTIEAAGDGVKSTSAKKEGKGFVSVSGGELTVTAGGDGIEAATQLLLSGGSVTVTTTGDPELGSSKGLKADGGILIEGGTFTLSTTDHAIRSAGELELRGGSFTLSSSMGRGISARGEIRISGEPELDINAIEDGILTDTDLLIEGGTFRIASGEDGLHAGDSMTGEGTVTISGGSLLISAYQDSIDAKSHLYLYGGNVLAVGRSKSLKTFSVNSTQPSVAVMLSAPSHCDVTVSAGESVLGSMTSAYSFTQVLFSRSDLTAGTVCTVSANGESAEVTAK